MAIDKHLLKELRPAIDEALKILGKKHGLTFHAANASYTDSMATFKLEITTLGKNGEVQTKEALDYKRLCSLYGLKESWLGQKFNYQGHRFKIKGLVRRAGKVLCKDKQSGSMYRIPVEVVIGEMK